MAGEQATSTSRRGFDRRPLGQTHAVLVGCLPESLVRRTGLFEELWDLHPPERPWLLLHGRRVRTPRWYQAFGVDYCFSGNRGEALPVPALLAPFLRWGQQRVDARMNSLMGNWYDGKLGHYIGAHRDQARDLVPGAPIVTVSFGESRTLRFRRLGQRGFTDVPVADRSVVVIPFETNRVWTHEVPRTTRATGRRVSLTIRAFTNGS